VGNSYYVSLPKEWVTAHGFRQGDLVPLELSEEGVIVIRPLRLSGRRTPRVRVIEGVRDPFREIVRAYLAGYEVIEVRRLGEPLKKSLDRLLRLLVGLEIVEEGVDRAVLQCFIREDYDVRQVLARMDSLSRSMYVDAAVGLEQQDSSLLESVVARDDKLDRLYFLAVRLLRSSSLSPVLDSHERMFLVDARLVAKILEEIGDEAERMSMARIGEGRKIKGIVKLAKAIARCQEVVVERFIKGRCSIPPPELKVSLESSVSREEPWNSLNRIACMVLDLAEIAY